MIAAVRHGLRRGFFWSLGAVIPFAALRLGHWVAVAWVNTHGGPVVWMDPQ